jgi:hypothetical protein
MAAAADRYRSVRGYAHSVGASVHSRQDIPDRGWSTMVPKANPEITIGKEA